MKVNRQPRVTLKDIAQATGYSANTVSHALAGKSDISEKTKALIRAKAEEMGYVGNAFASSLRSGVSRLVAIVVGDIANPHFSILIKEMEQFLQEKGYTAIVFNTEERPEAQRRAVLAALGQNVAGLILCPSPGAENSIAYLQERRVPFVFFGRRLPGSGTDSVVCDDQGGGLLATRYLLERGHRRILFLNGDPRISSAQERQQGYFDALREAGLSPEAGMVRTIPVTAEKSRELIPGLLAGGGFTALLAFSDLLAWEAVCALKDQGQRVPGNCSVIGFDNIQSRFSYPLRLTSVSFSKAAMATKAVEVLLARIQDPALPPQDIVLPVRLAEGETVRREGAWDED